MFTVEAGVAWSTGWELREVLFRGRDQAIVAQITSSYNNNVGTHIVGSNKIFNMIFSDVGDVLTNTEHGLTDEMVTERGVMNSFKGSSLLVTVVFNTISVDLFTLGFDLVFIVERILKDVT